MRDKSSAVRTPSFYRRAPALLSTGKVILHILSSNQLAAPAVRALEALNAQVGRRMCLIASENVNGFQE